MGQNICSLFIIILLMSHVSKCPQRFCPVKTVFPVTGSVDLWFPADYRACTVLSIMEHKAKELELKTAMQAHGFSFPQACIVVKRQRNLNGNFIAANFSSVLNSYGAAQSQSSGERTTLPQMTTGAFAWLDLLLAKTSASFVLLLMLRYAAGMLWWCPQV